MRTYSELVHSARALEAVEALQLRFVQALEKIDGTSFIQSEWLRDEGLHGGGTRYGMADSATFGRASVNVSQVHYPDEPTRKLASASALSTIVHPAHPKAPSVHIHISWTELKSGAGYWRIMADLNPAWPNAAQTESFFSALNAAAPEQFDAAKEQGENYFFIPALNRHRGVAHFYLESYHSGNFEADHALALRVGETAVDTYCSILSKSLAGAAVATEAEQAAQLAYHTLYFFQVLTLDRGTTAGLLVHNQNDIGILGSLPPKVDKNLLFSWRSRMVEPQGELLDQLLAALPYTGVCTVDDGVKQKLADAVRKHYNQFPEALDLQAAGDSKPPTIENHK